MATTVSLARRPLLEHGVREHRQDLVAVDDGCLVVDRQAAVGVTVEREADVRLVLEHSPLQALEGRVRPQSSLMFSPSGWGVNRGHLGPRVDERLRTGLVGGPLQAGSRGRPGSPRAGWSMVRTRWAAYWLTAQEYGVTRPTSPPTGRFHSWPSRRSMALSIDVVELLAASSEELDAVVGHRVVGGGEHHAEVGPRVPVRWATPGGGRTPRRSTSTPADARPATTAASRN